MKTPAANIGLAKVACRRTKQPHRSHLRQVVNRYVIFNIRMRNILFLIIIFFSGLTAFCQEEWSPNLIELSKTTRVFLYLDTTTLDTIIDNYIVFYRTTKSKNNIELSKGPLYGGLGTACGCEPIPNGHWIKRNRNGSLNSIGEYYCNKKMGSWIYFYDNGYIKKIENYSLPYSIIEGDDTEFRNANTPLLSGLYAEYYESGKIRVEGHYKIYEKFSNIDSVFTFDPDTYVETLNIIKGKFWIPTSYKFGIWRYFNEDETLMKIEKYGMDSYKEEKIRNIYSINSNQTIREKKKHRITTH